jgi:hypothetical protein
MNHPQYSCPTCGKPLPIKAQYGLFPLEYCVDSEHWRTAGLNPDKTAESFRTYVRDYFDPPADRRERKESLRAMREISVPSAPELDDDTKEASVRRMLNWLDEPLTE